MSDIVQTIKKLLRTVLSAIVFMGLLSGGVLANDTYQVLRQSVEGFTKVIPGRVFIFPNDHGIHPDYRIEWWYITANLKDDQGRDWGLQWTMFRQAMDAKPILRGWESNQLWMAHAAITTPDGHHYSERFARGGIGQAGVQSASRNKDLDKPFEVWIDDWSWQGETASPFPSVLRFAVEGTSLNLTLNSVTPWVLQGKQGYSQKSGAGQASYYYSQPHITVEGTIIHQNKPVKVTGQAWLDREWSSQPLSSEQQGWDWFSLHLKNGYALMVFRLRQADGQDWFSGSWIEPNGASRTLETSDIIIKELERRWVTIPNKDKQAEPKRVELPLSWAIELPTLNKRWQVDSLYDQQWMGTQFPYWEGVVNVDEGRSGMGYMELTGYPIVDQ